MKEGPDIARVAALIGDPARANMLSALMDGRALTATELSNAAGISASTTSIHLGRLAEGGLVRKEKQGRHRYYRLAGPEVAVVLEAIMGLAQKTGATRVRTGPRDPALRQARVCYDHLAGEKGVALYEGLIRRGVLLSGQDGPEITEAGHAALGTFGVDTRALARGRRQLCRDCLDWSMRRHHLAGALGAALWSRMQELGWAKRLPDSRAVRFTREGDGAFDRMFGS